MANNDAVKITITYADGHTKELDKGICWNVPESYDDESAEITAELVGCSGKDLACIILAAVQLGEKLGMFNDN